MPSVFGCDPSGSMIGLRCGNSPNELVHRVGPSFLVSHYCGYQYIFWFDIHSHDQTYGTFWIFPPIVVAVYNASSCGNTYHRSAQMYHALSELCTSCVFRNNFSWSWMHLVILCILTGTILVEAECILWYMYVCISMHYYTIMKMYRNTIP